LDAENNVVKKRTNLLSSWSIPSTSSDWELRPNDHQVQSETDIHST